MNKHKMKGVRKILHELVVVRRRIHFSQYPDGRLFIQITSDKYSFHRGKHRGLPGRGMNVPRHLVDDLEFEIYSLPDTVLSYGSKPFTAETLQELSAVRPRLGEMYKEKISDDGYVLPKDFFQTDTPIHELGLRCLESAGMLPKGGLSVSKEFFEKEPVEMLIDPAKE